MELMLIILCVLLLIGWGLVLPIIGIVFIVKHAQLRQSIRSLYEKGQISRNIFEHLEYRRPFVDAPKAIAPQPADIAVPAAAQAPAEAVAQPLTEATAAQAPAETAAQAPAEATAAQPAEATAAQPPAEATAAQPLAEATAAAQPLTEATAAQPAETAAQPLAETAAAQPPAEATAAQAPAEAAAQAPAETAAQAPAEATASPQAAPKPAAQAPAEVPNASDSHLALILGSGVVLLCIAAIAFISSTWDNASNLFRMLSIGSFSAIFYAAFGLAKYKLDIPNSARAFYILGCVTLCLAVIVAEVLMSQFESSFASAMLAPTAVLSGSLFLGMRFFRTRLFPVLGSITATLFLMALSAKCFDSYAMTFFLPTVAGIIAYIILHKKQDSSPQFRALTFYVLCALAFLSLLTSYTTDSFNSMWIATFAAIYLAFLHTSWHRCETPVMLAQPILLSIVISKLWSAIAPYYNDAYQAIPLLAVFLILFLASIAIAEYIHRRHDKPISPALIILQLLSIVVLTVSYRFAVYADHDIRFVLPFQGLYLLLAAWYLFQGKRHSGATAILCLIGGGMALVLPNFGHIEVYLSNQDYPSPDLLRQAELSWAQILYGIRFAIPILFMIVYALLPTKPWCGDRFSRERTSMILSLVFCATIPFWRKYGSHDMYLLFFPPAMWLTFREHRRQIDSPVQCTVSLSIFVLLAGIFLSQLASCIYNRLDLHFELAKFSMHYPQFSLTILAGAAVILEHILHGGREKRPYRLISHVAFSILLGIGICSAFYLRLFAFRYISHIEIHELYVLISILIPSLGALYCLCAEQRKVGSMPALGVLLGITWLYYYFIPELSEDYFPIIPATATVALMAFVDGLKRPGYTPLRAVWALGALPLLLYGKDSWHVAHFAGVLILSLNLLQYLTAGGKSDSDRTLITLSAAISAIAISIKILILPQTSWLPVAIRPELAMLVPATAAWCLAHFAWQHRRPAPDLAYFITLFGLIFVYAIPDQYTLWHACFVTAVSLAAIVIGMRKHAFRFILLGILCITIIVIHQSRAFWLSLPWWVYVASVGAILIAIAVINEMERRKGSNIVQRIKALPKNANSWKW